MQQFARILLEVEPLYAHGHGLAVRHVEDDFALADHRRLVLADLIALRQIRVEIILAIEHRIQVDPRFESKPGADGLLDAFVIDHRQHARHGGIDERNVRVGLAAERSRSPRKELRLRGHLGMNFHANDHLPVAGCSLDEFRALRRNLHEFPIPCPSPAPDSWKLYLVERVCPLDPDYRRLPCLTTGNRTESLAPSSARWSRSHLPYFCSTAASISAKKRSA